jgi:CubicO group peptidase (beta-lactamase class C family)
MSSFLKLCLCLVVLTSCKKENSPAPTPPESLYFPPSTSSEWETVSPESLGWNTGKIPQLLSLLESNGTRAFVVLVNGRIAIEAYFGKTITGTSNFTANSNWYWASAGKTLTAWTVGKAQEDGFLDINNKTSDYLGKGWTSLTSTQEDKITVRNQLTMTTGLDDGVANSDDFTPASLIYKADAGTRWAYHNAPYTLLEQVVENATDKTFDTYFDEILKSKTGMDGFWLWSGNNHVYYSTARAMARYGLLILNNGKWKEEQLMKDSAFFNQMINTSQDLNLSYGYLWWLNGKSSYRIPQSQFNFPGSLSPNAPSDMVAAMGKNGQYLNVISSKKMVLVRMGENPESVEVPFLFQDDIWEVLKEIVK